MSSFLRSMDAVEAQLDILDGFRTSAAPSLDGGNETKKKMTLSDLSNFSLDGRPSKPERTESEQRFHVDEELFTDVDSLDDSVYVRKSNEAKPEGKSYTVTVISKEDDYSDATSESDSHSDSDGSPGENESQKEKFVSPEEDAHSRFSLSLPSQRKAGRILTGTFTKHVSPVEDTYKQMEANKNQDSEKGNTFGKNEMAELQQEKSEEQDELEQQQEEVDRNEGQMVMATEGDQKKLVTDSSDSEGDFSEEELPEELSEEDLEELQEESVLEEELAEDALTANRLPEEDFPDILEGYPENSPTHSSDDSSEEQSATFSSDTLSEDSLDDVRDNPKPPERGNTFSNLVAKMDDIDEQISNPELSNTNKSSKTRARSESTALIIKSLFDWSFRIVGCRVKVSYGVKESLQAQSDQLDMLVLKFNPLMDYSLNYLKCVDNMLVMTVTLAGKMKNILSVVDPEHIDAPKLLLASSQKQQSRLNSVYSEFLPIAKQFRKYRIKPEMLEQFKIEEGKLPKLLENYNNLNTTLSDMVRSNSLSKSITRFRSAIGIARKILVAQRKFENALIDLMERKEIFVNHYRSFCGKMLYQIRKAHLSTFGLEEQFAAVFDSLLLGEGEVDVRKITFQNILSNRNQLNSLFSFMQEYNCDETLTAFLGIEEFRQIPDKNRELLNSKFSKLYSAHFAEDAQNKVALDPNNSEKVEELAKNKELFKMIIKNDCFDGVQEYLYNNINQSVVPRFIKSSYYSLDVKRKPFNASSVGDISEANLEFALSHPVPKAFFEFYLRSMNHKEAKLIQLWDHVENFSLISNSKKETLRQIGFSIYENYHTEKFPFPKEVWTQVKKNLKNELMLTNEIFLPIQQWIYTIFKQKHILAFWGSSSGLKFRELWIAATSE